VESKYAVRIAPYIRWIVTQEHPPDGRALRYAAQPRRASRRNCPPSCHSQRRVADFIIERGSRFPRVVQLMDSNLPDSPPHLLSLNTSEI
jgi:hypothetical protein